MQSELKKIIGSINSFHDKTTGKVTIPDAYFYPSAIAVITAYLYANKIRESDLSLLSPRNKIYFDAIGLGACLFHNDQYKNHRVKSGVYYSPIVHIQSADAVDTATSTINSCITSLTQDSHDKSIKELKHVVGELHDNVWSHGLESGFSMAQRSKVPHTQDYFIEFALADNGLGFLEETKRAQIPSINTHQEAIDWCIKKGNTTKPPKTDLWTQSVPEDCISSPYPTNITVATNTGSHHQGLGLAKLIDLVNTYHGELDVASGDTILHVRNNKNFYELLPSSWKGVAISCRLKVSELCNGTTPPKIPSEISSIMKLLRGG